MHEIKWNAIDLKGGNTLAPRDITFYKAYKAKNGTRNMQ